MRHKQEILENCSQYFIIDESSLFFDEIKKNMLALDNISIIDMDQQQLGFLKLLAEKQKKYGLTLSFFQLPIVQDYGTKLYSNRYG